MSTSSWAQLEVLFLDMDFSYYDYSQQQKDSFSFYLSVVVLVTLLQFWMSSHFHQPNA